MNITLKYLFRLFILAIFCFNTIECRKAASRICTNEQIVKLAKNEAINFSDDKNIYEGKVLVASETIIKFLIKYWFNLGEILFIALAYKFPKIG